MKDFFLLLIYIGGVLGMVASDPAFPSSSIKDNIKVTFWPVTLTAYYVEKSSYFFGENKWKRN